LDKNLISVIVTAHDRRKYLPFALKSLESQTIPKDKFEVIVVKNFEDNISDEIVSRNKWKNIVTDEKSLSSKIAIGFKESKGDIITFLEDDDLYREDRLAKVYETFNKFNDLIYFHNSQELIFEKGIKLEKSKLQLTSRNLVGNGDVIIDIDRLRKLARDYKISVTDIILRHVRILADVNNSSLAVKKYVLEHNYDLLMMIPIGIDNFIFAASIKTG